MFVYLLYQFERGGGVSTLIHVTSVPIFLWAISKASKHIKRLYYMIPWMPLISYCLLDWKHLNSDWISTSIIGFGLSYDKSDLVKIMTYYLACIMSLCKEVMSQFSVLQPKYALSSCHNNNVYLQLATRATPYLITSQTFCQVLQLTYVELSNSLRIYFKRLLPFSWKNVFQIIQFLVWGDTRWNAVNILRLR